MGGLRVRRNLGVKCLLKARFTYQFISPYSHSQTFFSDYSSMPTPPTTPVLPHPPVTPVPMLINTDTSPLMPELRLPAAIATTQNVLLPTTSSCQPSPVPNLRHLLPLNPMSTLATDKHLQMTVAIHHREPTTKPSPKHRNILPECVPFSNSAQHPASPRQSPGPFNTVSVAQGRELPIIHGSRIEADQ